MNASEPENLSLQGAISVATIRLPVPLKSIGKQLFAFNSVNTFLVGFWVSYCTRQFFCYFIDSKGQTEMTVCGFFFSQMYPLLNTKMVRILHSGFIMGLPVGDIMVATFIFYTLYIKTKSESADLKS